MAASTTTLVIDPSFATSLEKSCTYPRNLLHQTTYTAALDAYQQRINNAEATFETEVNTDVLIHDFNQTLTSNQTSVATTTPITNAFSKTTITSLQQLKEFQGLKTNVNNHSVEICKSDPKCRVIFLWAKSGRDSLKVTKEMVREILTFHQVMPSYLDLLFLFGNSIGPNDLKFGAFREQSSLRTTSIGCDAMYRSGQQYEICYNLKTIRREDFAAVPRFDIPARVEWHVKQAAVYHKFDIKFGTTVWIFTRGALDLEKRFTEVTGPTGRQEDRSFDKPKDCFRSSLAMHAFMIHWASESWSHHLQFLDEKLDSETKELVNESRKPGKERKEYTARDLQTLHIQCDTINDAVLAIESNVEVLEALRAFYRDLAEDTNFILRNECKEYIETFLRQSKNAVYDLKMQISRARALANLASDRKNLMLHYINAQIAEKQEDLTNNTYAVTISAENEAIVMRIITLVTLLFLPATFVSTFFSAPLINFQPPAGSTASGSGNANNVNNNDGDNYALAFRKWLEITVPLTVVTMLGALALYLLEKNRRQRERERQKEKNWV